MSLKSGATSVESGMAIGTQPKLSRFGWKKDPSSIHWNLSNSSESDTSTEDDYVFVDTGEFCCHPGCSFVYNVQQNDCLARESFVLESVPLNTYLRLAQVFGLDPDRRSREENTNRCKLVGLRDDDDEVEDFIHLVSTEIGELSDASEDRHVEVGTLRDSIREASSTKVTADNPYLKFMKRTSVWGEQQNARYNLGRRSKELTKTIINEFLDWYKSIGGEDEEATIDESVLQDLFQVGFDSPTARAIALRIKEMPVVPETLAELRNEPEFSVGAGLKKLMKMDIQLEERPPKLFAFGRMLPTEPPPSLRFRPPKNQVKKTWTECERVPSALDTLKVVWDGIENLRSTIAFSNWLKQHPEITPPGYLKQKGLLDVNYEEWMQIFKGFEVDIESEGVDGDAKPKSIENLESTQLSRKSTRIDDFIASTTLLDIRSSYEITWKQ